MKKRKKIFLDIARTYRDGKTAPPCRHFGQCGGCSFQDISYENQLAMKRHYLDIIFEGLYNWGEVYPSRPFQYRGRMDFVTAFNKCGLRQSGSYRNVVDIEYCPITQEKSNGLLAALRPLIKEIEDYNYLDHKGYLRYVVLRQAMYTGMAMVNFVVAEEENRLGNLIDRIYDSAESISLLFNDSLADLSFGRVFAEIKGGTIEDNYDGTRLSIAPNSFMQSNSEMAVIMYKKIRDKASGRVLDLYSGVGSISLFAAPSCQSVTGVEILPEAVERAGINKVLNGTENANFICSDAQLFLEENKDFYDTVILDPPRSGMHPRVIKSLKGLAPARIIYMSCNPETFKRDLQMLDEYNLESLEAFDMFPQTPHIETLAVLER